MDFVFDNERTVSRFAAQPIWENLRFDTRPSTNCEIV